MKECNIENERQNETKSNLSPSAFPLLSIIVPVYNAEQYLEQCLDSILNQQFTDFEVLCVNDGSRDRSGEILDDYARLDSRIKVFHIENQGVSHARNYGIKKASGNYVSFVDSDDWIDSDHFSCLMKCFDDPDVDWASGLLTSEKMDVCYDKTRIERQQRYEARGLSKSETINAITFGINFTVNACKKVFKKSKIKNLFNEKITLEEDMLFCYQYAFEAEKSVGINRASYHYRNFGSPTTDIFKNPSRISGLRACLLMIELLSQGREFVKNRDRTIYALLTDYYSFVSYYNQTNNNEALASLKEYKLEIHKYLRLFWKSSYYNFFTKFKISFKVCFPKFWTSLRRLFGIV